MSYNGSCSGGPVAIVPKKNHDVRCAQYNYLCAKFLKVNNIFEFTVRTKYILLDVEQDQQSSFWKILSVTIYSPHVTGTGTVKVL